MTTSVTAELLPADWDERWSSGAYRVGQGLANGVDHSATMGATRRCERAAVYLLLRDPECWFARAGFDPMIWATNPGVLHVRWVLLGSHVRTGHVGRTAHDRALLMLCCSLATDSMSVALGHTLTTLGVQTTTDALAAMAIAAGVTR